MGEPAVAFAPQVVKISSKRQITIPVEAFRRRDFKEYAVVTLTERGIEVTPVDVEQEDLDVRLLADLVKQGFEGEELVRAFEREKRKNAKLRQLIQEAEDDIAAGRVYEGSPISRIREIGRKYGLHD